MKKKDKTWVITVAALVLIMVAAYIGGTMSIISGEDKYFRIDDHPCTGLVSYDLDNVHIEYTGSVQSQSFIDPDRDQSTYCAPQTILMTIDGETMFEYDAGNGGIITDRLSSDPRHDVYFTNYDKLDDGSEYTIPSPYIGGAYFLLYSKDEMLNLVYESDRVVEGQQFTNDALYVMSIRNAGWDSSGRTTGSKFQARIEPGFADIESTAEIIDGQIRFTVESRVPTPIAYQDVCMKFGSKSVTGVVVYDEICKESPGSISRMGSKVAFFEIPESDITDYYLQGDLRGMQLMFSTITTAGVESRDIERYLIDGNRIAMGDLIGDEVLVTLGSTGEVNDTVIENPGYIEEPNPLEDRMDGLAWYVYLVIGVAVLMIIIVVVTWRK